MYPWGRSEQGQGIWFSCISSWGPDPWRIPPKHSTKMVGREALVWLLLVSNHLLLVPEAAQPCPDDCFTRVVFSCRCPKPNGKGSSFSWVGHGGTYVFPVCLDAIPTDFSRETQSVFIEHLSSSSSTLLEQSFHHLRIGRLETLSIRQSNVSAIQPRAFCGLQHLRHLYLPDNRISRLGKSKGHFIF